MENFNYQEYRNNLAKDLKEIRKTDPEEARSVLEEEKQTTEYKEAENVYTKERHETQSEAINENEYLLKDYSYLLKKYNSLFEKVKNIERRRMDPNDIEINFKIQDADEERHNTHLKLLELGQNLNKTREDVLFDIIRQKSNLEEIGLPEFSILQHDDIIDTGDWHNRFSVNLDSKNPSIVLPPLEPGKRPFVYYEPDYDEDGNNVPNDKLGPIISEDKCILLFAVSTFEDGGMTEVCPNDFSVRKERALKFAKEINEKLIDLTDSAYHEVFAHIIGVVFPKKDLEKVANIIIKNPQKFRLGYEFYSDSEKSDIMEKNNRKEELSKDDRKYIYEIDPKSDNVKRLTEIEEKNNRKEELSKDDLKFIYKIDLKIKSGDYECDSLIKEIISTRKVSEDIPVVLDCQPAEIVYGQEEYNQAQKEKKIIKAYIGPLFPGIFSKNLEHIYSSFPDSRIEKVETTISTKSSDELFRELREGQGAMGIKGQLYRIMRKEPEFKVRKQVKKLNLIKLKVQDLGFKNMATLEQIFQKAEELGLELCPPKIAPYLILNYKDIFKREQPEGESLNIGMNEIHPKTDGFDLFSLWNSYTLGGGYTQQLSYAYAQKENTRHPEDVLVFTHK